MVHPVRSEM